MMLQEILAEMKDDIHEDEDNLKEFSAVGAGAIQGVPGVPGALSISDPGGHSIEGPQAPLGKSSDEPIPGTKKKKKHRRKKPSWS